MTEIVYTHSFDTEYTSSVIDEVYYSEPHKLLFVSLVNGTLAGYDGVPLDVFNAMNALNTNRLNGDTNASVGRYWNVFVKNHHDGFSTADVELVSSEEVAPQESFSFFNDPQVYTITDVGEVAGTDVAILPVDPPKALSRFGITFESGDQEVSLNVIAEDIDDAVDRFTRAAEILGWDDTPVLAATKFFV